jgi:hypothetical protein
VLLSCQAGDALFLPEGWWHQVDSSEVTIAVNFWWRSPFDQLLGTHMDCYYLRRVLQSFTDAKKQAMLQKLAPANAPLPKRARTAAEGKGGTVGQQGELAGEPSVEAHLDARATTTCRAAALVAERSQVEAPENHLAAEGVGHLGDRQGHGHVSRGDHCAVKKRQLETDVDEQHVVDRLLLVAAGMCEPTCARACAHSQQDQGNQGYCKHESS